MTARPNSPLHLVDQFTSREQFIRRMEAEVAAMERKEAFIDVAWENLMEAISVLRLAEALLQEERTSNSGLGTATHLEMAENDYATALKDVKQAEFELGLELTGFRLKLCPGDLKRARQLLADAKAELYNFCESLVREEQRKERELAAKKALFIKRYMADVERNRNRQALQEDPLFVKLATAPAHPKPVVRTKTGAKAKPTPVAAPEPVIEPRPEPPKPSVEDMIANARARGIGVSKRPKLLQGVATR